MSKPQLLLLDPAGELKFNGPFSEVVTSHLKLSNTGEQPVNFKVKTTAPRFYCVRPNSGVVLPGETVKVNVMLQPVDQPQTLEKERSRHKFMVQSAVATDEPLDTFWKLVEPGKVTDARLKVVFGNVGLESGGASELENNQDPYVSLNQIKLADESAKSTLLHFSPSNTAQPSAGSAVPAFAPSSASSSPTSKPALLHRLPASAASAGAGDQSDQVRKLNLEIMELKHKITQLTLRSSEGGPLLNVQTILVVLAALLIGIILGKLF